MTTTWAPGGGQPGEGLVGELDRVDRRQRAVVDVAGHDHEVDLLGLDGRRAGGRRTPPARRAARPGGRTGPGASRRCAGCACLDARRARRQNPPVTRRARSGAGVDDEPVARAGSRPVHSPAALGQVAPPGCDGAPTAASTPDAGGDGLLDDLEADPAAHARARDGRGLAGEQPGADDLVDRVVPADVLAHDERRRRSRRTGPAACSPPVESKTRCASRSRSGSAVQHLGGHDRRSSHRRRPRTSHRASTSSMLSVPHTPQAEDAADEPGVPRGAGTRGGARPASTVTTLNSCSRGEGRVGAVGDGAQVVGAGQHALGVQEARRRARSRGPGVRIVTATRSRGAPGQASRISSGSSVASRSSCATDSCAVRTGRDLVHAHPGAGSRVGGVRLMVASLYLGQADGGGRAGAVGGCVEARRACAATSPDATRTTAGRREVVVRRSRWPASWAWSSSASRCWRWGR